MDYTLNLFKAGRRIKINHINHGVLNLDLFSILKCIFKLYDMLNMLLA